jgi:hypothetical protein
MTLPEGAKILGVSAITYIDKAGKRKTITAKKNKELFYKLSAIIKNAEKEGILWREDSLNTAKTART